MIVSSRPALVLAPMEGITDAPMRALQGAIGRFDFAVSEFVRVSQEPIPAKVFRRDVPELLAGGLTHTGLPVYVQLLGGDPDRMGLSALNAVQVGAQAIDINFGCPAPTVNRNDGGATLLKYPARILEVVSAIRDALPPEVPVSAKLRLGWDDPNAIYRNAEMAARGGASWITIHARTRVQNYAPPVDWRPIRTVRLLTGLPVVANGDIWTLEDFLRCQDVTGAKHFMIGRSAMADPTLSHRISRELGLASAVPARNHDWAQLLRLLINLTGELRTFSDSAMTKRCKQWLRLATSHGQFVDFDRVKCASTTTEILVALDQVCVAPLS